MSFQPMLSYAPKAKKPLVLEDLVYPVLGSYKYDGFRAVVLKYQALTRKLKPIRNDAVRDWLQGYDCLNGCDGELVVGDPAAPDCFNRTSSLVTTKDAGRKDCRLILFDWFLNREAGYRSRHAELALKKLPAGVVLARQQMLHNANQLKEFEGEAVALGYEGIMVRSLDGPYKCGRSTLAEQYLVKIKRFEDSEARVIGIYPRQRNDNPKEKDERGYSKRSSHKSGKVDLSELGGFHVRDVRTRKEFDVAPGVLTQGDRKMLWANRDRLAGRIIKYRFQPAGVKELPRFPRFVGWRSRADF